MSGPPADTNPLVRQHEPLDSGRIEGLSAPNQLEGRRRRAHYESVTTQGRLGAVLAGSPYSLPHDAAAQLDKLDAQSKTIRQNVRAASEQARQSGLLDQVLRDQRYREVYESNALEFEGPDLKGTIAALESPLGSSLDGDELRTALLPRLLAQSPDLHAVIGLEAARLYAGRLLASLNDRPLVEADVRSLHGLVTAGHDYAGVYKRWHVQLGGDTEHEPVLPIEVSYYMRDLAAWNEGCEHDSPILHAAALHAWLTHIHPFEDGNGRVARLLANMALAQADLPPAIVKARTQRAAYLDALGTSDQGGDIMPLAGLFAKTLTRFAVDMQKPRFFRKLFADLIAGRGDSRYDAFVIDMTGFLNALSAELRPYRLTTAPWDSLDFEAFSHCCNGSRAEPTTVLMIEDEAGGQVAVQVASASPPMARYLPSWRSKTMWTIERPPSLRFAIRGARSALDAYPLADPFRLFGLQEVAFEAEAGPMTRVLINGAVRRGSAANVAEVAAAAIGRAFSAQRIPTGSPARRRASTMPRVNGGPG